MLDGDDHRVHSFRDAGTAFELVLAGDLSLGIGSGPPKGAVAAELAETFVELVGEHHCQRHALFRLVGGVTEHEALVAGAYVVVRAVEVDAAGYLGRLLVQHQLNAARLVVEALAGVVVANVLDRVPDDAVVVDVGLGRDLAHQHDHPRLGHALAGHLGVRVLPQVSVQNGIAHLVAQLVRVAFADALRREEKNLAHLGIGGRRVFRAPVHVRRGGLRHRALRIFNRQCARVGEVSLLVVRWCSFSQAMAGRRAHAAFVRTIIEPSSAPPPL